MNAYALLMRDSVVPFGEIYSDWSPRIYQQPSIFFTFLLTRFRDLEMSDFARDFIGAVVSDRCGGGRISPLSLYQDVRLNLKTWKKNADKLAALGLDNEGEIADQANRGDALLKSLHKIYGEVADIPNTVPLLREIRFVPKGHSFE